MNIKEKFENHPVIFGLTLMAVAFGTGIKADSFLNGKNEHSLKQKPEEITYERIVYKCDITGLPELQKAHNARLEILQSQLLEFETKASNDTIITPYQDKYLESAKRVREDMKTENNEFRELVKTLETKCKNQA
ncbi:hypothetical protein AB6D92_03270 [Vibrio splendidus]